MSYDACQWEDEPGAGKCLKMAAIQTAQGAWLCAEHAAHLLDEFGVAVVGSGYSASAARELADIGRRASGIVVPGDFVPEDAKPKPFVEEPDVRVTKTKARAVAIELTQKEVRVKESLGRCYIRVRFPGRWIEFAGATWWLALRALNAHLAKHPKP